MKRIIDKKFYNTDTAELLHKWDNRIYGNDFRRCSEILYRTKKGVYFIAGYGGPMSKYAQSYGTTTTGGEDLIVLNESEVIEWLENHDGAEIIEKYFKDKIEEA